MNTRTVRGLEGKNIENVPLILSVSQWNELDGFDLDFEKHGDKSVPISDLDDFRNRMKGMGVVRIYGSSLFHVGKLNSSFPVLR